MPRAEGPSDRLCLRRDALAATGRLRTVIRNRDVGILKAAYRLTSEMYPKMH